METVSIIGLGYVGLPLACLCAEKGLNVYGVDTDKNKISLIKQGTSPMNDKYLKQKVKKIKDKIKLTENVEEAVKKSSVVIVCVPTPIDNNNLPNLKPLKDACESISKNLQKNTLVIIESTIFPGTTEEIVLPILKESNLKENEFFLAHCPERIDPGNKKYNISNLPRVVAGINKESTKKGAEFYKKIIDAEITELSSVKAAEATKIMENTFRDVNIAFINEMAKSFDKAGIDILEVIKGASTKPFAFMPHYPGSGVGGHCIKIDPYYLISKAKQLGFNHRFVSLAREINESMPSYTAELLENQLKKLNKTLKNSKGIFGELGNQRFPVSQKSKGFLRTPKISKKFSSEIENAKVGILGLAYKANVDDIRESPSLKIIEILKNKKAELFIFDPYIKEKSNVYDLNELLRKADYLILVTDHNEFKNIDLNKLKENNIKIVIDGRNCLDKEKIKNLGIIYHGIGTS